MKKFTFALIAILAALIFLSCEGIVPDPESDTVDPIPEPVPLTISYNTNNADSGTVPNDSNVYKAGEQVTVSDIGSLIRAGYTHTGWNTLPDGNGQDRAFNSTFKMGTENVTLYAKWTDNYTITFSKNDMDAIGSMDDQTIASGFAANLTGCGFTKIGWMFTGWLTITDGNIEYADGASYVMGTSNVTLYAKWVHGGLILLGKRDMVSVLGGTYIQKGPFAFPQSSFSHTIKDFQMAKYEVSYELWHEVYSWALSNGYSFEYYGIEGHDGISTYPGGEPPTAAKYEPVTMINWRDAIVWCNAYSQMAGYIPVYEDAGGDVLKNSSEPGADGAVPVWGNNGYRLPTEGEWQYAAGYINGSDWLEYDHASGDESSYCSPNNANTSIVFGDFAWYSSNSSSSTHEVGSKTANHLDIYDMSGNVWEWCWDWEGDYPITLEVDYTGLTSGTRRVSRGGSALNGANPLQICYRDSRSAVAAYNDHGFRVSRRP